MIEPPYYSDDFCSIFLGDSREIVPELAGEFAVIVSDPPYGISMATNSKERGRDGGNSLAVCNDFPPIFGDDEPFDPAWLLALGVPSVLFGANHYADKLPPSPSWWVWDKLDGLESDRDMGFNNNSDVELMWTNLGGPARLLRQRWMGAMKSGREASHRRVHPTQKPVELMTRILSSVPEGVVLDPYMGSGTTLRAAKDLGRKAIGIEISEAYAEVAVKRLAQGVLDFG